MHKESTGRVAQVAQVLAVRPDVAVMCCDSPNLGLVVSTMALGGHGTANMTGNVAPAELATLSTPWRRWEDAAAFQETYLRILPVLHFTYSATNPVPVKSLMKALGLPAGVLRRPLCALEGPALAAGLAIVQALGLDRKYGYKVPVLDAGAGSASLHGAGEAPAGPGAARSCALRWVGRTDEGLPRTPRAARVTPAAGKSASSGGSSGQCMALRPVRAESPRQQ